MHQFLEFFRFIDLIALSIKRCLRINQRHGFPTQRRCTGFSIAVFICSLQAFHWSQPMAHVMGGRALVYGSWQLRDVLYCQALWAESSPYFIWSSALSAMRDRMHLLLHIIVLFKRNTPPIHHRVTTPYSESSASLSSMKIQKYWRMLEWRSSAFLIQRMALSAMHLNSYIYNHVLNY